MSVDATLGLIPLVGAGGTRVEFLADCAIRLLLLERSEAEAMLDDTRIPRLLADANGGWASMSG